MSPEVSDTTSNLTFIHKLGEKLHLTNFKVERYFSSSKDLRTHRSICPRITIPICHDPDLLHLHFLGFYSIESCSACNLTDSYRIDRKMGSLSAESTSNLLLPLVMPFARWEVRDNPSRGHNYLARSLSTYCMRCPRISLYLLMISLRALLRA